MKEITLTKGKVALVDDADFEYLNQWKWCVIKGCNTYYAIRGQRINGKLMRISMHRLILGLTDKRVLGDHKDHNGLNNQRYNLRVATKTQNNTNILSRKNSTSKYLGVNWYKAGNKWRAQIMKNKSKIYLGSFHCEIEAAKAYNKAAIELHGEFANLNNF